MASTSARTLAVALGLAASTLIAVATLRRERAPSAPTPRGAQALAAERAPAPALRSTIEAQRSALEPPAPVAPHAPQPPALHGRVLDEAGLVLADVVPRVELRGGAGQRLVASVDAQGAFGPLLLAAGTWEVTASAPGRLDATRRLVLAEGDRPAPLELRLPHERVLLVRLVAIGPGSGGDPERDLADLAGLLCLRLGVPGEEEVQRRTLAPRNLRKDHGRHWGTFFRLADDRPAELELHLGGERVARRDVRTDDAEVALAVDPLELGARLVALEIELRDPRGEPLADVAHARLAWEGGAHLVAGLAEAQPWRARFERCPSGPARLSVVDQDGRRAETELRVPQAGPARLAFELELREPERR